MLQAVAASSFILLLGILAGSPGSALWFSPFVLTVLVPAWWLLRAILVRAGITTALATGEFERGPIIGQQCVDISYPIRVAAAIERLLECYVGLADSLGAAISGGSRLIGNAQDESKASYSLWRDDEDYFIDWTQPAGRLRRFVDATGFPYRGTASRMDGETLRVLAASELDDVKIENQTPGKVLFLERGKFESGFDEAARVL